MISNTSEGSRGDDEDWYALRVTIHSTAQLFAEVYERNKNTESRLTAGALIGYITNCRRERVITAGSAIQSLLGLTSTAPIWSLVGIPDAIAAHLSYVIYEEGLPAELAPHQMGGFLADLISHDDGTYIGAPLDLATEFLHLCAALAARVDLNQFLDRQTLSLRQVLQKLESDKERFRADPEHYSLYGSESEYAIRAIRATLPK